MPASWFLPFLRPYLVLHVIMKPPNVVKHRIALEEVDAFVHDLLMRIYVMCAAWKKTQPNIKFLRIVVVRIWLQSGGSECYA